MIDRMVICSPFVEPNKHWAMLKNGQYEQKPIRRNAGYVRMKAGSKKRSQEITFVELEQVNHIRQKVSSWRNGKNGAFRYSGTTVATRRLLEYWTSNENQRNRDMKFFWCQIEAIETIIWLAEIATDDERKKLRLGDGGEFERWCSKMATGTGKTVVMGMLIAWQTINYWQNSKDPRFTNKFLVIAPNLTIYERLQTLRNEIYEEFDIIPNRYRGTLSEMKIAICNWHKFKLQDDTGKQVVYAKKGRETSKAFATRILGFEYEGKILVINDEGHHAWRDIGGDDAKWMQGLDEIHDAGGILRCHDFSATPFRPNPKFRVFGWIISDFGFMDAIESGLVKTPVIGGVIEPGSGMVPFSNNPKTESVYRICERDLNKSKPKNGKLSALPDQVRKEYARLAAEWHKQHTNWIKHSKSKIGWSAPPVFITICNNTHTAERVFSELQNGKFGTDIYDKKTAIHMDSEAIKALKIAEQLEIPTDTNGEINKKKYAEILRQKINTVGKHGEAGALVNNITSVNMLSEGWDAKNVQHILGLRAFDSQLLCEQVIGRGLRRVSYEIDEEGMFPEERVTVIGVPFQIMPLEGKGEPVDPILLIEIAPDPTRKKYSIEWPNVIGSITKRTTKIIQPIDWNGEKHITISNNTAPTEIFNVDIDQKRVIGKAGDIPFKGNYENVRMQSIIFEAAARIYETERELFEGEDHTLFPHITVLVREALDNKIIQYEKPQDSSEEKRLLICNMGSIVRHIWRIIVNNSRISKQSNIELDPYCQTRSTHDIRHRHVPKHKAIKTKKTHTIMSTFDSSWEKSVAKAMDNNPNVVSYIRNNSAVGFTIDYRDVDGTTRQYFPDFLVVLVNGTHIILEIKGYEDERNKMKATFANLWTDAVSEDGRFGRWEWKEIYEKTEGEVRDSLHEYLDDIVNG